MRQRLSPAQLTAPFVMTVLGLAILISLGTWQMHRKVWKEDLMAAIAQRSSAPPADFLSAVTATRKQGDDAIGLEYLRVKVRGRFDHSKERYFYAPDPSRGPGYNVTTPLEIAGSPVIVFVNRGFVPETLKDPASRASGQTTAGVDVVGLIRESGHPGRFTPDNNPAQNMWYWRDVTALKASAYPDGKATVMPFIIDQEAFDAAGDGPKGGATIVSLTNRHLEYAITWYGLALTLAAIFAAYAMTRLRATKA